MRAFCVRRSTDRDSVVTAECATEAVVHEV